MWLLLWSYLASQAYDPNVVSASQVNKTAGEVDEKKAGGRGDEQNGRMRGNQEDMGGSTGQKSESTGTEKGNSLKETDTVLNKKNFDREKAVAEAKMWGENWRRANAQTHIDG